MKALEREYPVEFMSEVLNVSTSGYYAWRKRDNSGKEAKELKLLRAIEDVNRSSRKSYGSPRVFNQLIGMGHKVGKTKVERTMKKHGIRAKTKRKFRVTTDSKHNLPVAPNLLERNFSPEKPNQTWASDITYGTPSRSTAVGSSQERLSMFGIRKFPERRKQSTVLRCGRT